MIQRRGLLAGMLAAFAAPAIVRSSSLMPGRAIWLPPAVEDYSRFGMYVVGQHVINNDSLPSRLDVLYGWVPHDATHLPLRSVLYS